MEIVFHQSITAQAVLLLFFILFNLIILISWWFKLGQENITLSERFVVSFLAYLLQIILVAIFLGATSLLHRYLFIFVNMFFSFLVMFSTRHNLKKEIILIFDIVRLIKTKLKYRLYFFMAAVIVLVLFRNLIIALLNIPSIGDDLLYHLPAVFQWITDHKISVFPTQIIYQVSYPLNTELLFLNPAIFFKNDSFILFYHTVCCMIFAIPLGYAILRSLSIGRFMSLVGGLLLFLTPGLINGTFSGYIDTFVNLELLLVFFIFVKLLFCFDNKLWHYLYFLVLALLLGSKYSGIFIIGYWSFLYFIALIINRKKHTEKIYSFNLIVLVGVAILIFGLSWYVKNFIFFGNPLVPQAIFLFGRELFESRLPEASNLNLYFSNALTSQNNIDFSQYFFQANSFFDKIIATAKSYYSFPEHYSMHYHNLLGRLWAYVGFPLSFYALLILALKRRWREFFSFVSLICFYLMHPFHMLFVSRYTLFIIIIGIFSILYLIEHIKINSNAKLIVLFLTIFFAISEVWVIGYESTPNFLKSSAKHYRTGEYFGLGDNTEVYLKCYDYLRLRTKNKNIAYIGGTPYPYTYALYGKDLSNKVFYFNTLDPNHWFDDIKDNKIDMVYYLSAGPDNNFEPILVFMKNNPNLFQHPPLTGDQYDTCRSNFVFSVIN